MTLGLTVLTVIGMVAAAVGTWSPVFPYNSVVTLAGIIVVYLAGGVPAGLRALDALWREHVLDIDLLMVVAAVAAAAVGAPLEGAVLLTLFSMSTTLESRALGRARRAIEALMALRPETALRKSPDGKVSEVAAADLVVGDVVVLRPGARVPVDGVIAEGHGSLDESTITGESMPVLKEIGAAVIGGSINQTGGFVMQADRVGADTLLARIVQMVARAQRSRAPIQRLADRVAGWFVPLVVAVAVA
ncbi:MAG: HAD-IC family P-type ATPase, partial [Mesorhizobium sp.]|nr:HAD-IC family P-type ATPase [Mesorhizobium sp.]